MSETGERLRVHPQLKVHGGNVDDHTQLRQSLPYSMYHREKEEYKVREIRRRELWEVEDTQFLHTWIEPTHHLSKFTFFHRNLYPYRIS